MHDLGPVLTAANAKLDLINRLERETNELLQTPMENLMTCLECRQATLKSIIEADNRLRELCAGSDELIAAVDLTCDFESLPIDLKPLLELSLSARASINRIMKTEPEIAARLQRERASLLKKIENLNTSTIATANKYYRSFNTALGREAAAENNKTI